MPDPKPHHRRAAAECFLQVKGRAFEAEMLRWVETLEPHPELPVTSLTLVAQAIADAEEQSDAKLQTLRAESLRIAAELLRLSGTDVLGVEMLLRTHVVELAMKLKEAYLVAGEQPGRLIGGDNGKD